MSAYYNEIDPYCLDWLRNLMAEGLIAPGDIDNRDIQDVVPNDLKGYTQCHFFAGIGGWSTALRMAGVPDDERVWTGSCPCQPFAASGKRAGFTDERHLWPSFFWLIEQCRPERLFGEQTAAAAGLTWLDLVSTDLEGAGYTVGTSDLPAAGVGAPHIRQRLWFVAERRESRLEVARREFAWRRIQGSGQGAGSTYFWPPSESRGSSRGASRLADPDSDRLDGQALSIRSGRQDATETIERGSGLWSAIDWHPCADGKFRPIESGIQLLAHGIPNRGLKLRAFGNAICAPLAAEFIRAVNEAA